MKQHNTIEGKIANERRCWWWFTLSNRFGHTAPARTGTAMDKKKKKRANNATVSKTISLAISSICCVRSLREDTSHQCLPSTPPLVFTVRGDYVSRFRACFFRPKASEIEPKRAQIASTLVRRQHKRAKVVPYWNWKS